MLKVSVIMPVYNVGKYLRACLYSVINQTLKDIEIICINDGSTDNSLEILEEFAKKDKRIIVINQENSGAAVARNKGIAIAQGKYLSILDSDDIFEQNMLEKLISKAEDTESDIVVCRSKKYNVSQKCYIETPYTIKKEFLPNKEVFNYKDITDRIFDIFVGWSWDKLYRADFVRKHNLEFQNLRSTNDALFVFLSIILAERISTINDVLITHIVGTGAQLSETRDKDPFCFLEAVLEIKNQLEKRNLYNAVERSFINWFIPFSIWHVDSLSKENSKRLIKKLSKEIYPLLGIYKKKKSFFLYNKTYYKVNEVKYRTRALTVLRKKLFQISKSEDRKKIILTLFGLQIKFKIRNKNNKIYIIKNNKKHAVKRIKGLNIKFNGSNSTIELYANPQIRFKNSKVIMGDNCHLSIKESKYKVNNTTINMTEADNASISIGKNFSMAQGCIINRNVKEISVNIGDECMFSADIYIRSSDGHTIYDNNTGEALNKPQDINIGNHVWLGNGARVLKGSTIKDNTIVGNLSLVTKKFDEENCVIAGIPAQIVKRNVNWDIKEFKDYFAGNGFING